MPFFNRIILVGHTTRLPDVRTINDVTVANCGIATNRKYKDKEEQMFIDFTCFGKQAEYLGLYVTKGDPIMIEGRLALDTWEQEDGQKRSKHKVIVENIILLKSKKDTNTETTSTEKPAKKEDIDDIGLYSD